MKTKKMVLVLLIVFGITFFLTTNSIAANAWYTCNINYIGANPGATLVMLTDTAATPAFTNKWFSFSTTCTEKQLATALTAVSLGWTALVYTDKDAAGYPTVINFYLEAQ